MGIVSHQMGNMPVEVLNLGEEIYGIIFNEWKVSPVEGCDGQNHIASE